MSRFIYHFTPGPTLRSCVTVFDGTAGMQGLVSVVRSLTYSLRFFSQKETDVHELACFSFSFFTCHAPSTVRRNKMSNLRKIDMLQTHPPLPIVAVRRFYFGLWDGSQTQWRLAKTTANYEAFYIESALITTNQTARIKSHVHVIS